MGCTTDQILGKLRFSCRFIGNSPLEQVLKESEEWGEQDCSEREVECHAAFPVAPADSTMGCGASEPSCLRRGSQNLVSSYGPVIGYKCSRKGVFLWLGKVFSVKGSYTSVEEVGGQEVRNLQANSHQPISSRSCVIFYFFIVSYYFPS